MLPNEEKIKSLLSSGSEITGAAAGSAIGFFIGGPVGAAIGGASGVVTSKVLSDIADRLLSGREKVRVGATAIFALEKIKRSFPLGRQKHQLDELLVKDAMKIPAIWTEPNISITKAASIMLKKNVGALPILENGKLVGIVSRTDLLNSIPR